MSLNYPLRTGIAFSITAGIGYAACSLLFWLWPEAAVTFTNALFHGLDFHKLQGGPALFDFSGFLYALVVLMIWAFALGTLFGWVRIRIGGGHGGHSVIDPVCGMSVDPTKPVASYDYRGKSYFFCSHRCLGSFRSDPDKYIGGGEHAGHAALTH